MLIPRLALYAALVVPITVHAQATKVAPKPVSSKEALIKDEGDSFLGIPFAEAFPGDMVPCPVVSWAKMPDRDVIETMSVPCFFQAAENKFDVLNGPDLGLGHTVEITTYRGYPALFKLTVFRARFPQMVQVFSNRYGPAHRTEEYPAYTKAGETFQFQSLHWKGKKITVLLDEGSGDIRRSVALVTSRIAEELRDADKKRAAEAAAGKL